MNYYLFIFKKTKIIACVQHTSVEDAVSHLLNWGGLELPPNHNAELLVKEIDNVLLQKFSNSIFYGDGIFGSVFSSDYINTRNSIKSELMNEICSRIKSSERNSIIDNILDI